MRPGFARDAVLLRSAPIGPVRADQSAGRRSGSRPAQTVGSAGGRSRGRLGRGRLGRGRLAPPGSGGFGRHRFVRRRRAGNWRGSQRGERANATSRNRAAAPGRRCLLGIKWFTAFRGVRGGGPVVSRRSFDAARESCSNSLLLQIATEPVRDGQTGTPPGRANTTTLGEIGRAVGCSPVSFAWLAVSRLRPPRQLARVAAPWRASAGMRATPFRILPAAAARARISAVLGRPDGRPQLPRSAVLRKTGSGRLSHYYLLVGAVTGSARWKRACPA